MIEDDDSLPATFPFVKIGSLVETRHNIVGIVIGAWDERLDNYQIWFFDNWNTVGWYSANTIKDWIATNFIKILAP